MDAPVPRWRRRKTARPGEIVSAAIEVFAERGFAAAKLEDIAARAGVSKGSIYLYFDTKADLFEAVVRDAVAPNVRSAIGLLEQQDGPLTELAPALLARMAAVIETTRLGGVAKLVIGESQNFPELARIWLEVVIEPALGALTAAVARAQARGEVRAGDPRLYAVSLIGPMVLAAIWGQVMQPIGAAPMSPSALAAQHGRALLHGMLAEAAT